MYHRPTKGRLYLLGVYMPRQAAKISAPKRATFKRSDIAKMTLLYNDATQIVGGSLSFKPDHSDITVAARATEALGREISEDDARRVRHQILGKMLHEGRPTAEMLQSVLRAQDALAAQVRNLAKRVEELEADYTEPEPVRVEPKSNGASPYRR